MKYVLLRCEDQGGFQTDPSTGLLEVGRLAYLQRLAQAGAVGRLAPKGRSGWRGRKAPDQERAHAQWEWFWQGPSGLHPERLSRIAGRCYAASLGVTLGPEETAWCCELVTHHDGRMTDATAGQIPTHEAVILIQALNEQAGGPTHRWVAGEGSHHLLITRVPEWASLVSQTNLAPAEHVVHHAWRRHLPRQAVGQWLRELLERAAQVLEHHEVNRVRIDLGENPANLMWVWGPSSAEPIVPFTVETGLSGAIVSSAFARRGLARLLGMTWIEGPSACDEAACRRTYRDAVAALERYDLISVHVPIAHHQPVDRQCAMERIDQLLLKPLAEALLKHDDYRCVVAIEDRTMDAIPFVAVGTNLASRPVARLTRHDVQDSALVFHDGVALFRWLIGAPVRHPELRASSIASMS